MSLLLVGVGSTAILLDETFGLRGISDAVLIVSVGVVEVMRQQNRGISGIVDDPN